VTESNDRLLAVKDDDSLSLLPYAEDQLAQDASIAANAEAIKALDALADGGVEEAPVDGLQYARQDEGWVEVEGSDFDGEHVLIGDPAAPPDGLDVGQLLWDGVEGSSGGGGDAGPHSHTEYAPAEHDHDDYLPLAGGALTGDLQVDGQTLVHKGSGAAPGLAFSTGDSQQSTGMFYHADYLGLVRDGETKVLVYPDNVRVMDADLQVDGNSDLKINVPADFWQAGASGTVFNTWGMVGSTMGGHGQSMTSNGYRNKDNKWTSMEVNNHVGAVEVSLEPTGLFRVRVSADFPTGSASNPPVQFFVTESGPSFRAMPSKTRTVDDILERAETAEFPPEDVEGVATMDGHDEVPLFEVVSALLAKVKELSAEIEELKGA
jgi:hypothetical protein